MIKDRTNLYAGTIMRENLLQNLKYSKLQQGCQPILYQQLGRQQQLINILNILYTLIGWDY